MTGHSITDLEANVSTEKIISDSIPHLLLMSQFLYCFGRCNCYITSAIFN